jgi:serine/threonine-protein kinase
MAETLAPEFVALQQAVAGRYSLERELGRGGMGIVFLARDVALDRPVAIKLLPPALAGRAGLRDRFLREAQTAAKLSQPNIVPIHAVERAGDLVFFVMSFIDGETLGQRLRVRGPLPPQDAARVMREVAWALGYAHGRGVVHRDIKPDNIMLERGTGRAVVMDFGIAALAADARGGEVLGTAEYISPEQASGEAVDGRADLYSLGVVAFLALTGRLPFQATDPATLLALHIGTAAPPVASVTPGLPRRLAQAVDRCLAKQPADRFPDGEALADCVEEAVESRRQLPVPVRFWLTKNTHEMRLLYIMWYALGGVVISSFAGFGVAALAGPVAGWVTGLSSYVFTPVSLHVLNRLWRTRRLLAEGYSVQDVHIAIRDLAERRREELAYEYAREPSVWAKGVRWVMIASGSTLVPLALGVVTGLIRPSDPALWSILVGSWTWLGTAVLQTIWPGKRITRDRVADWRLRFWNTRLAKWFERLARFGLTRRAAPAELTYRPTELAIGIAADALFESLPKEQRREIKELPALIERLQGDAQRMRQTVDELNGALHSSAIRGDRGASAELATAHDTLRADLSRQRDDASRRLAAAVAALEGIRLSLLRLKAGTGSMSELTADLDAARAARAELEIEVSAQREVQALLDGARALTGELRTGGEPLGRPSPR